MYRDILSSKKPTVAMKDDFAVNLRTGEVLTPAWQEVLLADIKNPINQFATGHARLGIDKALTARAVADWVKSRGPIGSGRYRCTCNNFGPRWLEDSSDGCCPGCFAWAEDHHYEVPTSDLDPNRVTREMIKNNTWGICASKIKILDDE